MGKKMTFGGFVLALLSLIPAALFTLLGSGDALPAPAALTAVIGLPVGALISFAGMLIWAVVEIRHSKRQHKNR